MPLSDAYTARVLLVHGKVTESNLEIIYKMIMAVENDPFLKLYTTDLMIDAQDQISMRTRDCTFEILIGDLDRLDQKITNFKAFYQKAKKDSLLKRYKCVNLKFNQQVVGIK
jgi:cell division protein FtsQ